MAKLVPENDPDDKFWLPLRGMGELRDPFAPAVSESDVEALDRALPWIADIDKRQKNFKRQTGTDLETVISRRFGVWKCLTTDIKWSP